MGIEAARSRSEFRFGPDKVCKVVTETLNKIPFSIFGRVGAPKSKNPQELIDDFNPQGYQRMDDLRGNVGIP